MVDHELGGDQRVDALRVAAEVGHRIAHRREIDDRGHAGQVLQEHPRRHERDLPRGLGGRIPASDGVDVLVAPVSEHVLEQDAKRVRKPREVVRRLQLVEPEDVVRRISDHQL